MGILSVIQRTKSNTKSMRREFYTCDDRIFCLSNGNSVEITEKDTDFIDDLLLKIENFYPDAFKALKESYSKSSLNVPYFKFLMARRFLKCNFGELDTTQEDIDSNGIFHFEKVSCPMRGECKHECVICMPRFSSKLTDAEMRVMRVYYQEKNNGSTAELLYLSVHTVKNHIKASYAKLGIHTRGEFITYASKHQLFG